MVRPSAPVSVERLAERLDAGLAALALDTASTAQRDLLIRYLLLMQRWNGTHNLTAVHDPMKMVSRHLLDSLAVLPYLPRSDAADIGSGAGLPGIPLAICRPGQPFTLVEPAAKRAAFLRTVIATLNLEHVRVSAQSSEDYHPESLPGVIVSRATAPLARLDTMTRHLQGAQTQVFALKGPAVEEELMDWPRSASLDIRRHVLHVPELPPRILISWKPRAAA